MSDYSDLVEKLHDDYQKTFELCAEAADALEAQAKRIAELEHQLRFECNTYLWNRKRMSRRIAM